mgnify:CR=1 FL=1|tara:strand:+ start:208 stop:912 length:705 start_codon:yes stop_codon:yes gene_type:complete
MTTLFNFNLKKNTGVIYYTNKKIIRKFSINKKKKKMLNEFNGFNWYLEKSKHKLNNKKFNVELIKKNNYINYPIIKAIKVPFWAPLKETKEYIEIIIKHYLRVWPNKNKVHYHGDLTIDNVLFRNFNNPVIIDWEYFKKDKLWGLDICHLLISSVVQPVLEKKNKKIPSSELELLKELWSNFFKGKELIYLKDPVKYLQIINTKYLFKPSETDFMFKITANQKKQLLETINNEK